MGIARPVSGSWGWKAIQRLSKQRTAARQNARIPLACSSVGAETENKARNRISILREIILTGAAHCDESNQAALQKMKRETSSGRSDLVQVLLSFDAPTTLFHGWLGIQLMTTAQPAFLPPAARESTQAI
jgi:hypothetical protein